MQLSRIYNPHGSDVTSTAPENPVAGTTIYNPHGSDVTDY